MAKVEGVNAVMEALRKKLFARLTNGKKEVSVIVGYTQNYSLYVHENLEAHHKEGKQAKYLEEPARRCQKEIADKVTEKARQGASLEQSLLMGGLLLQRRSMEVVPIDTGALRASAFTKVDE